MIITIITSGISRDTVNSTNVHLAGSTVIIIPFKKLVILSSLTNASITVERAAT